MKEIFDALGLTPDGLDLSGAEHLPSAFEVTELVASAQGAVGMALADLVASWGLGSRPAAVQVDRRLASLWCASSIRPEGWEMPPVWDAVAGDYKARDGWIRLHTNAPHHREAALRVLDVAGERDAVAEAVSTWDAEALEAAVVDAGGAAAAMRSAAEWADHPQGRAVAAEPLVAFEGEVAPTLGPATARPDRPLAGLKVLDLTRVLAGPVATRALAGFGAEVLRIDPPDFDEPTLAPDVTLGKACARLDLRDETDRAQFERLLPEADLLVHGYRPGALEGLGYGAEARAAMNPALREVTLDAYGWTGPWAMRRGFDSLVQMSCGIAHAGMAWAGPRPSHPPARPGARSRDRIPDGGRGASAARGHAAAGAAFARTDGGASEGPSAGARRNVGRHACRRGLWGGCGAHGVGRRPEAAALQSTWRAWRCAGIVRRSRKEHRPRPGLQAPEGTSAQTLSRVRVVRTATGTGVSGPGCGRSGGGDRPIAKSDRAATRARRHAQAFFRMSPRPGWRAACTRRPFPGLRC